MIDHVSITVEDLTEAEPFCDAIMAALGCPRAYRVEGAVGYGVRSSTEDDGHSYISVFAGGRDDGEPGLRPEYHHPSCYAAFVGDPDGNRIEAVRNRGEER